MLQQESSLDQERTDFLRLKQQLEAEFNQKRAKFKELYLSKEGTDHIISNQTVASSTGSIIDGKALIDHEVSVRRKFALSFCFSHSPH